METFGPAAWVLRQSDIIGSAWQSDNRRGGAGMSRIFLSYRRDDSADSTGRIYDRLEDHFGSENLVRDVDSIPPGCDFWEYISDAISESEVLLVVIGRNWQTVTNASGERRLADPRDPVRIEIEVALKKKIPIMPVVVQGAPYPDERQLPKSLKSLAFRSGIAVRPDPDFHRDVDRLIETLDRLLEKQPFQKVAASVPISSGNPTPLLPARSWSESLFHQLSGASLIENILAIPCLLLCVLIWPSKHSFGGVA